MRIVLVDDHDLLRRSVRAALELRGDVEVVADASGGAEGLERVAELLPDVALIDVNMEAVAEALFISDLRDLLSEMEKKVEGFFDTGSPMSGYTDSIMARRGLSADESLLEKPFSAEILLFQIERPWR